MFGPSIRLFYFRGVPVELTVVGLIFIAIFILPIGSLGGAALPLILGLGLGVLFSIFIHEMAHALVGMWLGATVVGIKLDLLGGVTLFARRPPSYFKDLLIFMAGPTANLILWKGCELASQGMLPQTLQTGQGFELGLIFYFLSTLNLFLAVFNALPAYPLDGGQAVYALVNWITGRDKFAAGVVLVTSCFIVADMFFSFTGLLGRVYIGGLFTICLAIWIITSVVSLFTHATQVMVFRATPRMVAEEREKEAAKRAKTHKGEAAFQAGNRYLLEKEYQQAIDSFTAAIELEPKETRYLDYRAYTYAEMGAYQNALADYSLLIKQDPRRPEYYSARAQAYLRLGNPAAAWQEVEQALTLKPTDDQALRLKKELNRLST